MPKAKKTVDYQRLSQELETIMNELQRDDIDVDAALKNYQRGLEIVQQLEEQLTTAENTVKEIKSKFKPKD